MSAYQEEKERFEMRLAASERKLAAQCLRTEAAVNMASKIGNMTPEEISVHIDGEAQGFIPRVLIVDDEVDSRHLFKEALASFTVVRPMMAKRRWKWCRRRR